MLVLQFNALPFSGAQSGSTNTRKPWRRTGSAPLLLTYLLLKYSGKKGRMVTQTLSRSGVMYSPMKAARHENSMR